MKTVLLAGGFGSRISEESAARPKPMVEIGGKPILWHIMQIYGAAGFNDFVIACGYKAEMIKEYFYRFYFRNSDFTIDLRDGRIDVEEANSPDWRVSVVDTGINTMTGGRLLRLRDWLNGDTFMVTYGDGLADIDLSELLAFHRKHGKLATVTAVRPPARFGGLQIDDRQVTRFIEKPQTGEGWINGGFFVFQKAMLDTITGDDTILEREPLERLASEGQLMAFEHEGFWQPMDTLREKHQLETLWASGQAPWSKEIQRHDATELLFRQNSVGDRSHGIQGIVASDVASHARRESGGSGARAAG